MFDPCIFKILLICFKSNSIWAYNLIYSLLCILYFYRNVLQRHWMFIVIIIIIFQNSLNWVEHLNFRKVWPTIKEVWHIKLKKIHIITWKFIYWKVICTNLCIYVSFLTKYFLAKNIFVCSGHWIKLMILNMLKSHFTIKQWILP